MPLSTRPFGRTGRTPTAIGFGAWAIGGTWGEVTDTQAKDALNAALDAGMTFIDTADVYGDGLSERRIAQVLHNRPGPRPFIASKVGRRLNPHAPEGYTLQNLSAFIDRSRTNLEMDTLDLVQLHCPPTPVYSDARVYDALDTLKAQGKIANYGVSVERIDEALTAMQFPGVTSVQIVYNLFRQRPADTFFAAAKAANIAVIARIPLASGLLTGKMTQTTTFAADDHRSFNRDGAAFDKGETFSGVPFEVALQAVEALRPLVPQGATMAAFALRWVLMADAISVVIPGAKSAGQSLANAAADAVPPLDAATKVKVRDIYQRLIAPHVAHLW